VEGAPARSRKKSQRTLLREMVASTLPPTFRVPAESQESTSSQHPIYSRTGFACMHRETDWHPLGQGGLSNTHEAV
jgi:hypothetical protein